MHEAEALRSVTRSVAWVLGWWVTFASLWVSADELNSHAPACVATGPERLLIADVDELNNSQKFDEVIQKLGAVV